MVRRRKRVRRDPYGTNLDRLSVYPSYRKHVKKSEPRPPRLSAGDRVKVRIVNVDDDGKPMGKYNIYTIVVDGEVMPGEDVVVEIVSVQGRTAWAKPVPDE